MSWVSQEYFFHHPYPLIWSKKNGLNSSTGLRVSKMSLTLAFFCSRRDGHKKLGEIQNRHLFQSLEIKRLNTFTIAMQSRFPKIIIVKSAVTITAKPRQIHPIVSYPKCLPKMTKRQPRKRTIRKRAQATSLRWSTKARANRPIFSTLYFLLPHFHGQKKAPLHGPFLSNLIRPKNRKLIQPPPATNVEVNRLSSLRLMNS